MDEVDNIIIHSLRQIGCKIDEDIISLSSFAPELLVETVSKCLQLIRPSLVLPKSLPPGMAQRFSATAGLAEACVSIGFRGDIGYQTFLYSNVTEVRRVFMFLIERLPKETEKLPLIQPLDKLSALENEISRNVRVQLNSPWIPQYCYKSGIRKYDSTILSLNAESTNFQPQLNLNIPKCLKSDSSTISETHGYWLKRSPSIFQQTNSQTICPSIIHKNNIELYNDNLITNIAGGYCDEIIKLIHSTSEKTSQSSSSVPIKSNNAPVNNNPALINNLEKSVNNLSLNSSPSLLNDSKKSKIETQQSDKLNKTTLNPLEELNLETEKLKCSIDELLGNRRALQADIISFKESRNQMEDYLTKLRNERRVKERTGLLLENPEVNVVKMEAVLAATNDRMKKLAEQWEEHRTPLAKALESSTAKNSNKSSQNKAIADHIKSARMKSAEVSEDLKSKAALHTQLVNELQKIDKAISRTAYTSRILEIIGNIRKQKSDIDKVLRDTRELQKEINNITGQLDRQFTVTDDLLFKTAKRDEYSKTAYKLLATLHSDCSDLVTLVQETGAVMREVRDVEDQIENEKARNISTNLEKITSDLKQMEKESKGLQDKIRKVENQITQG